MASSPVAAHISGNLKGVVLAVGSSLFIGSSFIFKKKGLRRSAISCGNTAAFGGHGYLREPLWWLGLTTMIFGEISNFIAYIFAPAVLVTPLGALSIIVSSILAHILLGEKLTKMGIWGCILCITGSTLIVLHAPEEKTPNSVDEIWNLATQPEFLLYTAAVVSLSLLLMLHFSPRYGHTNILIDLGICSMIGSLTVMGVKAVGIALKLTLEGRNQVGSFQAWIFAMIVATCVIIQLNYLNKALDTFNTAVVSPIYYVMFTTFTIIASSIMFKDWNGQKVSDIASEICGFVTVLAGTCVLHSTREAESLPVADSRDLFLPLSPRLLWPIQEVGGLSGLKNSCSLPPNLIAILRQDHFS